MKKFHPGRGTRILTYAVWWIRQAVAWALANQARTIRLPVHIELLLGRHAKAKAALTQELGVTRERVRQIEAAALDRLRRLMAGRAWRRGTFSERC